MGDFSYPDNMHEHINKIFEGEYALLLRDHPEAPVVLDLGANVGAFAYWALRYWPGSRVICYEPNPAALSYFRKNLSEEMTEGRITLHDKAVSSVPGRRFLFDGKFNLGEASLFCLEEQQETGLIVDVIHPKFLPPADILKVDTEGCEYEIISELLTAGREYKLILFEYHSEAVRRSLDALLAYRGYDLICGEATARNRGTLKYAHRSLV